MIAPFQPHRTGIKGTPILPVIKAAVKIETYPVLWYRSPRAEVAQLAEHSPEKAGVDSSILSLGTT